jgi:hypothetical protein
MIRTLKTALLAGLAFAATAAPAERNWLTPNATVFSGEEGWVTIDGGNSGDIFFPDHRPLNLEQIKVWAPDGTPSKIQNGLVLRRRAVFDVQLDKQGTWRIGLESANVMGSFKVNGEERRVGGRFGPPPGAGGPGGPGGPGVPPAGGPGGAGGPPRAAPVSVADIPADATDVNLTQMASRYDVFVTLGEPTGTVFKPTGKGLEFEPLTHPDELILGETARFRFLVDGKPAAGLEVEIIPAGGRYRNAENGMKLKAGADGIVLVKWPNAGLYWLGTTLTDDKPTEPRANKRRLTYNATLEVLTP